MSNKLLIALMIFSSAHLFAQTDWQRWEAKEINYAVEQAGKTNRGINSTSFMNAVLSGFQFVYGYAISDVDGDNCPFTPTCSNFFVQSVKRTNFAKGLLMFADRFTRDSNIFKQYSYYPSDSRRHYWDPIDLYIWKSDKLKIFKSFEHAN